MDSKKIGRARPTEIRLQGLYDQRRTKELAEALLPITRGECSTIDMSDVDHIERSALTGFLPLIKELRPGIRTPRIGVIGMNEDIKRTLDTTGLAKYFHEERRVSGRKSHKAE